jgi:hypothetical protein
MSFRFQKLFLEVFFRNRFDSDPFETLVQHPSIKSRRYSVKVSMPKSLYRSRSGRHFYGTENVICDGFGLIGNNEKKKLSQL